ncbi:MAG: hypothetical protein H6633_31295 [Anaerolineales bacterium]|nr:hypothetical protein [Anaerolineales bacterium]
MDCRSARQGSLHAGRAAAAPAKATGKRGVGAGAPACACPDRGAAAASSRRLETKMAQAGGQAEESRIYW